MNNLIILIVAYVLFCCVMYVAQRRIVYMPAGDVLSPQAIGLSEYTQVFIHTHDQEQIRAWYHKKQSSDTVMLYFHGNGHSLENRAAKYRAFSSDSDFSVLAITYRGYPGSTGAPTESGLYSDGKAAIQFLLDEGYQEKDIILYGESLGTGVATEMATIIDAKALVLESPFTSITDVAKSRYWFLPVSMLLKDRFDNQLKMQKLHLPLLIIHGEQDKIVPLSLGQALYDRYQGPKSLVVLPHAGHGEFSGGFLVAQVESFLEDDKKA